MKRKPLPECVYNLPTTPPHVVPFRLALVLCLCVKAKAMRGVVAGVKMYHYDTPQK